MQLQVKSLVDVIIAFGNPFEDDCPELLVLNSRECMHDDVIETVRSIEAHGKKPVYQKYVADVIDNRTASRRILFQCSVLQNGRLNLKLHSN